MITSLYIPLMATRATNALHEFSATHRAIQPSVASNSKNAMVDFVHNLLRDAVEHNVSDIHIESGEDDVCIRYSIDGVLNTACVMSAEMQHSLCTCLKVLSDMDIARSSVSQSGRISTDLADFRVASHPTIYGENIVIRVLRQSVAHTRLSSLGFSNSLCDSLVKHTRKPQGMVIVTGPTGSGKTTTARSLLAEINDGNRNIMTLEDPVEYKLPGVIQTSVDSEFGYAEGLKSILRQNPGVIYVGEIRDADTAQLAFRACMTGRLVITTLHTRSSLHTFRRLCDLGVSLCCMEENLSGVLNQRLVRKFCCGYCPLCKSNNGYRGRVAISEWLEMSGSLVDILRKYDNIQQWQQELCKNGQRFISHDAERCITAGITSIEEVSKVL